MKPAPPGAAVLADLVERLDDQRILADALGDRRQLAGLDQLGELRRLLEGLGELGGVGDDLGPFQLADQRALARALRQRSGGDDVLRAPTTRMTVSRDRSVRIRGVRQCRS